MKLKYQFLIFLNFAVAIVCAQQTEILIKPYLQDATPNSIIIKWETNIGEESVVEWGLTTKLGKTTTGIAYDINFSDSRVHEVKLSGLKRFTTYHYRVVTNTEKSAIYQFKTPPFASDNESFTIVAMSDMQFDSSEPEKFSEVVNQGVLQYFKDKNKGNLSNSLAMVMVPGDLVVKGSVYSQWNDHFFNPAEQLFAEVPLYPVPGNHERNSNFFFKYFSLPQNGTAAYAEHWWYKDYGNTRILGLDSNEGFRNLGEQLTWLQKVLDEAAKNEAIDFVFAQMHHPHKSELWIPGEADFSGKVVAKLEKFSTDSGKPSIHFFGHTHGYSRGQSKDHKHLMVNVASAGGAIDNWGEFEGKDYDEFTVTQDEYGFVTIDVDGDKEDPKFTLKRISRGNTIYPKDNELTDSITVWKKDRKPSTPRALSPNNGVEDFKGVVLKADLFASTFDTAFHAASHWQVSEDMDFEKLAFNSWKQYENWYYKENRQKDDDLTDEKIKRLKPNTTYFWRVRYRDQNLNWSNWSKTVTFKTK